VLIAQISDPHVRPKGQLYQNRIDSNGDFAAAISHLNRFHPRPDIVLLTGRHASFRLDRGADIKSKSACSMSSILRCSGRHRLASALGDGHAHRGYALVHMVEFLGLLPNPGLNAFGVVNAFKCDLQRSLHA
jgi:3',5'-cyclic AMP phosphodiesterase CpdA